MKRIFYIFGFVVLGIVLQQIVHTAVEIWYIGLLADNFDKYGFGWSWDTWFAIHHVGSVILFAAGTWWGYWQGRRWWLKLYDKNGRVCFLKPWRA